nr:hypothetical protein [Bradyrhizobium sp. CCBAU 51627]
MNLPLLKNHAVLGVFVGAWAEKFSAEAALHDEAGKLLAVAKTTWIAVDRDVQLGRG